MNDDFYTKVCAFRDVYKIHGRAYRIPSIIDDREMTIFKGILQTTPEPKMAVPSSKGCLARVKSGLMAGLTGRVIASNSEYVKLETKFSFIDGKSCIVIALSHKYIVIDDPIGHGATNYSSN